jgi:hypothetical protein
VTKREKLGILGGVFVVTAIIALGCMWFGHLVSHVLVGGLLVYHGQSPVEVMATSMWDEAPATAALFLLVYAVVAVPSWFLMDHPPRSPLIVSATRDPWSK